MSNKFKIIPLVYPIPVPVEGQQGKTVDVSELKLGRIKAKHLRLLPSDFSEKEGKLEPNAIIPLNNTIIKNTFLNTKAPFLFIIVSSPIVI